MWTYTYKRRSKEWLIYRVSMVRGEVNGKESMVFGGMELKSRGHPSLAAARAWASGRSVMLREPYEEYKRPPRQKPVVLTPVQHLRSKVHLLDHAAADAENSGGWERAASMWMASTAACRALMDFEPLARRHLLKCVKSRASEARRCFEAWTELMLGDAPKPHLVLVEKSE